MFKKKKEELILSYDKEGNLIDGKPIVEDTADDMPVPPKPIPIEEEKDDADELLNTLWVIVKKLFNREYDEELKAEYDRGFKDGRRKH